MAIWHWVVREGLLERGTSMLELHEEKESIFQNTEVRAFYQEQTGNFLELRINLTWSVTRRKPICGENEVEWAWSMVEI